MLDKSVFRLVKEQDFLLRSPLELRPYIWGSLEVYDGGVQKRMSEYHSKYDLIHWLKFWTEPHRVASPFSGEAFFKEVREVSSDVHDLVLSRIFHSTNDFSGLHDGYDNWNATDAYVIEQHCGDVKNVLDFGAGYARLGAALAARRPDVSYTAVDCVEVSYILQNLFLSNMAPDRFFEYFDYGMQRMPFDLASLPSGYIAHLPSWQMALIPDATVDLITSVFVLPEINEFALLDFVHHAKRICASGGYLYLRDHLYHNDKQGHEGAHRLRTADLLAEAGFRLVYQGDYKDNVEIYGIPRVFQKQA